jgi:hypothetical protein
MKQGLSSNLEWVFSRIKPLGAVNLEALKEGKYNEVIKG